MSVRQLPPALPAPLISDTYQNTGVYTAGNLTPGAHGGMAER